jgi:hypothetical protein
MLGNDARVLVVAAWALVLSPPITLAQTGLTLAIGQLSSSGTFAKQVVSVKNETARAFQFIKIECGFFSQGRLIAADFGLIQNLSSGGTGFTQVLASASANADTSQCRISEAQ